jgi:polysaccharide pyruvyl transferase WcaK-like protein
MGGGVPSAGISYDERIRNLMQQRGHSQLLLQVDDDGLEDHLFDVLVKMNADSEQITAGIRSTVAEQVKNMGTMGIRFLEEVYRVYPDFPERRPGKSWEDYLPALPAGLSETLEQYA